MGNFGVTQITGRKKEVHTFFVAFTVFFDGRALCLLRR